MLTTLVFSCAYLLLRNCVMRPQMGAEEVLNRHCPDSEIATMLPIDLPVSVFSDIGFDGFGSSRVDRDFGSSCAEFRSRFRQKGEMRKQNQ